MALIDPKLQKRLSAAITEFADRLRNLGLAAGDAGAAIYAERFGSEWVPF